MSDLAITAATALLGADTASGDLFPVVDVSAATPKGRSITRDELGTAMVATSALTTALAAKLDKAGGTMTGALVSPNPLFPTRNITISQGNFSWQNVGGSGFGVQLAPSTPTADRIVNFNPNGGIVSTADTGTVTNTMLAGSIAISKIAATGSANSTTYLRGDGSWATPSGGGGGSGGNWVLISTTTISGSPSTLEFTFSGSYRRYRLELEDVTQSSPFSYILRMQTSTDGGSTFDSSSDNYGYSYGPLGTYGPVSTTGTYMQLLPDSVIGVSGVGVWGEIDFYDPLNASTRTFAKWNLFGRFWSMVATNYVLGSGVRDSAADVDTVQLYFSSGNFAGGKIRLFGWSE